MRTLITSLLILGSMIAGEAASTINATNKFAYGANLGWLDSRGDTNNGAVIGQFVCSGYIYSANVGWISLGGGSPANGIQYQNNSAGDFGVNTDASGNLRGYAYGANIGWINFENTGAPAVDLATGKLSGSVWSANSGWISLSNTSAVVTTDTLNAGMDLDADGIPDAWERTYTNTLRAFTATSDIDGDGVSDKNEYLAGTNPLDAADYLRITGFTHARFSPTYTTLVWSSKPTRYYAVQQRSALVAGSLWSDYFAYSYAGANNLGFDESSGLYFYRIRAFRPLLP